jgi:hypothetical protein
MSRKFLLTIVLILFLLPFVSWYYLQSGLDWRKQAQEVMSGTKPFPSSNYEARDGRVLTADSLDNHVSLVCFLPCNADAGEQITVLNEIYNQFKETNKAIYILLDSCQSAANAMADASRKNWYVLPCNDSISLCNALLTDWPDDKVFALVDRKGVIRSYYGIGTKDEKRILVEHMSLLLPRERQEKVELKRGNKQ